MQMYICSLFIIWVGEWNRNSDESECKHIELIGLDLINTKLLTKVNIEIVSNELEHVSCAPDSYIIIVGIPMCRTSCCSVVIWCVSTRHRTSCVFTDNTACAFVRRLVCVCVSPQAIDGIF